MLAGRAADLHDAGLTMADLHSDDGSPEPARPHRITRVMLATQAVGLAAAVATFFTPLARFLLHVLVTLVHEIGHAVTAWLFGRPAVPAFDFLMGGGVTPTFERSWLVLLPIYALFAAAAVRMRRNRPALIALGLLGLLHVSFAFGRWGLMTILFMGHGFELVIAGTFLFRAWSCHAVQFPAERYLYAWLGWFIVLEDLAFGWSLWHDVGARVDYRDGKLGPHTNDFDRMSLGLGVRLATIASILWWLAVLTPVFAFLAFRYQEWWAHWWGLLSDTRATPEDRSRRAGRR